MAKISVITDFTSQEYKGGAEYYAERLGRLAQLHGFESEVLSFSMSKENTNVFNSNINISDFVILVNIGPYSPESVLKIVKAKPCTKVEMDYGFCKTRNALCYQCSYWDEYEKVWDKQGLPTPCKGKPEYNLYEEMYKRLQFITFINPHQRELYRAFLGDAVDNSILCLPFYCDDEEFYDMGRVRLPNSYFFCSRFYLEKGILNTLEFAVKNPGKNFFFMGFGSEQFIPMINNLSNCTYLGDFPDRREKLAEYYNMFEYYTSMPVWLDPGPIKIVEAELCGCKLLINENNKIRTWGWKNIQECRNMIRDSENRLFERIKQCM